MSQASQEKKKIDIFISLSKKGVQSRLPNEKRNREREHDTRSS